MAIPTYVPGYPPDGSSLGQTKSTIRNNLDGTFQTLAVDHINNNGQPGSKPAGYHTVIHEVTQTSVSTVSGYNQVFAGVPGTLVVNGTTTPAVPNNSDTQLYALTGAGVLAQLTGYNAATNGYAWAGGILFQWGVVNNPGQTGTVNFNSNNIDFPRNCFNVQIQLRRDGSTTNQSIFLNAAPSRTNFSWTGTSMGSHALYWVAIGN